MAKTTLEDLKNRRSIRAFKSDPVRDEDLDAILEAGTYAPSGANKQSAVIVVVKDKAVRDKLEELNAEVLENPKAKPFYGAPLVLAVLVDQSKPTPVEDGALVLGNLQIAASAIGVGACWIHRARQVFESPDGKAFLEKWGLKGDYRGVGFCILGYPEGPAPQPAPRKADYIIRV
ncbi:MAG: nitroreductase [Treponema sp.]|jgi:nitroreductase|nr:nitroreductase [Treponema sp.]